MDIWENRWKSHFLCGWNVMGISENQWNLHILCGWNITDIVKNPWILIFWIYEMICSRALWSVFLSHPQYANMPLRSPSSIKISVAPTLCDYAPIEIQMLLLLYIIYVRDLEGEKCWIEDIFSIFSGFLGSDDLFQRYCLEGGMNRIRLKILAKTMVSWGWSQIDIFENHCKIAIEGWVKHVGYDWKSLNFSYFRAWVCVLDILKKSLNFDILCVDETLTRFWKIIDENEIFCVYEL
jgi:hypothetical protein